MVWPAIAATAGCNLAASPTGAGIGHRGATVGTARPIRGDAGTPASTSCRREDRRAATLGGAHGLQPRAPSGQRPEDQHRTPTPDANTGRRWSVGATSRPLTRDELNEIEQRLREDRRRLLRTVATTDAELQTLEEREVGAPVEDAAREEGLGILARLENRELEELREITAALGRVRDGTYGRCKRCGEPLPAGRLRAVPTARHCVSCQARAEGRAAR